MVATPAAGVVVCPVAGQTSVGTGLTRRNWLPFIPPLTHFGLGKEARATRIEIRWPSGRVQTLENVRADQLLKVTEPAGQ
jgi:enediyne biosynthesis protein E4